MPIFDTCVFLKYLFGDKNLSLKIIQRVKQLITTKEISASSATLWEIECFSTKKIAGFKNVKQL